MLLQFYYGEDGIDPSLTGMLRAFPLIFWNVPQFSVQVGGSASCVVGRVSESRARGCMACGHERGGLPLCLLSCAAGWPHLWVRLGADRGRQDAGLPPGQGAGGTGEGGAEGGHVSFIYLGSIVL